jgi:hypothetical protein
LLQLLTAAYGRYCCKVPNCSALIFLLLKNSTDDR